ncbi:MAG: tRNA (adenosine(37)-N6)-threonylcarbamoyltransferase complex ATPase subunit type 1 TsaE [Ignavibacteriales bacterium]
MNGGSDRKTATRRFTTRWPAETSGLGNRLGRLLQCPAVIGLSGELGAGKTLFAQGVALGLGVRGYVKSPSFTLALVYRGRMTVYHLDVYRLDDPAEIEDLGFYEMQREEAVILVEWADRVAAFMPPERIEVLITRDCGEDLSRRIQITGYGEVFSRLVESLRGGGEPA